jgi:hypothetical protein
MSEKAFLYFVDDYVPQPPAMTCAWTQDEEGDWMASCGLCWLFEDGGPEENGLRYCPGCGKKATFKEFGYNEPPESEAK